MTQFDRHGIRIRAWRILLPFPYNHPIRMAERIATLDLWMAATSSASHKVAGRKGLGLLSFTTFPLLARILRLHIGICRDSNGWIHAKLPLIIYTSRVWSLSDGAVGIDLVLCLMQLCTIPYEQIMASVRLFGGQVIPYFQSPLAAPEKSMLGP